MNLTLPGFNIEVVLPSKSNTRYVAVACYANGLHLSLKHMLPLDGPGTNYWRLRGTLEILWATDNTTRSEAHDVSPYGDPIFLEAIDAELRRQCGVQQQCATWPDEMFRDEKPHVVKIELTCECCKHFVK